jgi:hypothetical protein
MRSTTLFGLHSQTTRLSERSTRSRRVPGVAYGIVTLLDVTVSGDLYPDDPPVTIGRKTTIREALGPPDCKGFGSPPIFRFGFGRSENAMLAFVAGSLLRCTVVTLSTTYRHPPKSEGKTDLPLFCYADCFKAIISSAILREALQHL